MGHSTGVTKRSRSGAIAGVLSVVLLAQAALSPRSLHAQRVMTQPQQTITIAKGKSALLRPDRPIQRVSVGDPSIADPNVLPNGEILINAVALGTTTLIYWDQQDVAHIYTIEVNVDAQALQQQIAELFPGVNVTVSSTGGNVILSGAVSDATVVRRIQAIAQGTGANIINNLEAPTAEQVLVKVRFAEVNRTAAQNLGSQLAALNPDHLDQAAKGDVDVETISDGIIRLFLIGGDAQFQAFLRAAKSTGDFRTLAEPNLLTLEGKEASFLAGGEFPYPAVQSVSGGQQAKQRHFRSVP